MQKFQFLLLLAWVEAPVLLTWVTCDVFLSWLSWEHTHAAVTAL